MGAVILELQVGPDRSDSVLLVCYGGQPGSWRFESQLDVLIKVKVLLLLPYFLRAHYRCP